MYNNILCGIEMNFEIIVVRFGENRLWVLFKIFFCFHYFSLAGRAPPTEIHTRFEVITQF